jgi:hypothetical protein
MAIGVGFWCRATREKGTEKERTGPHNANGAGIAADPTLTGVWMTFAHDASGEPSASFRSGPYLAPDV